MYHTDWVNGYMGQEIVHTPDGPRRIAGSFRLFSSGLIDVLVATLLLLTTLSLFNNASMELPEYAGWLPGALVFLYAYLTYRHKVPSLGNRTLALRRYPLGSIGGYAGRGPLIVREELPFTVRIYRFMVALFILGGLFLLFILL